jgi:hypothetical protein
MLLRRCRAFIYFSKIQLNFYKNEYNECEMLRYHPVSTLLNSYSDLFAFHTP